MYIYIYIYIHIIYIYIIYVYIYLYLLYIILYYIIYYIYSSKLRNLKFSSLNRMVFPRNVLKLETGTLTSSFERIIVVLI